MWDRPSLYFSKSPVPQRRRVINQSKNYSRLERERAQLETFSPVEWNVEKLSHRQTEKERTGWIEVGGGTQSTCHILPWGPGEARASVILRPFRNLTFLWEVCLRQNHSYSDELWLHYLCDDSHFVNSLLAFSTTGKVAWSGCFAKFRIRSLSSYSPFDPFDMLNWKSFENLQLWRPFDRSGLKGHHCTPSWGA